MKLVFIYLFIAFALSSCIGFYQGNLAGSTQLTQANFKYVEQNAQGQARDNYYLGITGGHAHETLVAEAKKDLLTKYPLKENQALVNISVNYKRSVYLGLVQAVICTVSADIVEFTK